MKKHVIHLAHVLVRTQGDVFPTFPANIRIIHEIKAIPQYTSSTALYANL